MKWSVGAKISACFAVVLAVVALMGISASSALERQVASAAWQLHTYRVLSVLDQVNSWLFEAESAERGFVITGDERYMSRYGAIHELLSAGLDELAEATTDNAEQSSKARQLKRLVLDRWDLMDGVVDLRRSKGLSAAQESIGTGRGRLAMQAVTQLSNTMSDEEKRLLAERSVVSEGDTKLTSVLLLGGVGFTAALLVVFAFFLTWNIARPLRSLTQVARGVALGRLEPLEPLGRTDEVGVLSGAISQMVQSLQGLSTAAARVADGDLAVAVAPLSEEDVLGRSFAAMVANLRALTGEISAAVARLVSASSEILASTVQVASSTSQTAAAIAQTSTTVEEVRHAARLSADKAKGVIDNAQHVMQVSKSGLAAVDEIGAVMERIRGQNGNVTAAITALSGQSQTIEALVVAVSDLADQSNLLAVNAAIEAARVGEGGKGFSVVAQEIKMLADQSKQSTAQVRALLAEVQRGAKAAVDAVAEGRQAIELGVEQAAKSGDSIRLLAQSVEASVQSSFQIAASSQEQSVGMDQIGVAMKSINQAGRETAMGMRQSEVAAQDLNSLGRQLQSLVSKFRW